MDDLFFREYAVGTRLEFYIKDVETSEKIILVINAIKKVFAIGNMDFETFFHNEHDIGKKCQTDNFVFIVNTWSEDKLVVLDVFHNMNILRKHIYELDAELKTSFGSENVKHSLYKRFIGE